MKWKEAVPLLVLATAVAVTSGCVSRSEPPPAGAISAPTTVSPSPTPTAGPSAKKPQPSAAAKPSATKKPVTGSNTTAAKPPAKASEPGTKQSTAPSGAPGRSETKAPKTWPKNARPEKEAEKGATEDFVKKTQEMPAPRPEAKPGAPSKALPEPPDYRGIAAGAALGELQGQFLEYANNNWKQIGEVVVVGETKVEDLTVDGVATHRVFLCLDSSALQVTEPDGFVVTPKVAPGTRTALNIYDLQEHDGQLVVVNHLFPEDPNC